MSDQDKTVHDFDYNLICEYYSAIHRQGPGSPDSTIKALSFIDGLSTRSRIADLGCGTGGQTMVLAQNAPGEITAIDLFPKFIEIFNANAAQLNLQQRVKGVVGSMDDLPFEEGSLNLIWSEGAIYNIGFERGLQYWRQYLKEGGYIAVTDATWFTDRRPAEIEKFWMDAYPQIDTIPNKVAQMQKAGYVPMAMFILPEECWTEHFYESHAAAREAFLKKYAGNKTAEEFIALERHEQQLYDKYRAFYGYAFYIGRKV